MKSNRRDCDPESDTKELARWVSATTWESSLKTKQQDRALIPIQLLSAILSLIITNRLMKSPDGGGFHLSV